MPGWGSKGRDVPLRHRRPGSAMTATRSARPSRPRWIAATGLATFREPAGLAVPRDAVVSLTGSHIRPQPGYGYDERRHVTIWGNVTSGADGRPTLARRAGMGLGRGRGAVLRVLRAVGRPGAPVLRRVVGGARDASPAAALLRLVDAARDTAAIPVGHGPAGRLGHPHRGGARLLRSRRRRADGRGRGAGPPCGQCLQRRVRRVPRRRRRQRQPDQVQRWLAGDPVRAGHAPPDGCHVRRPVRGGRRDRRAAVRAPRFPGACRDRRWWANRRAGVHGAAAEVRVSRARRDRGRDRLRAPPHPGRLCGPDRWGHWPWSRWWPRSRTPCWWP